MVVVRKVVNTLLLPLNIIQFSGSDAFYLKKGIVNKMNNILLYIFLYLLIGFCLTLIWGFIELKWNKYIDINITEMIIYFWPIILLIGILRLPVTLSIIVFERIFKTK